MPSEAAPMPRKRPHLGGFEHQGSGTLPLIALAVDGGQAQGKISSFCERVDRLAVARVKRQIQPTTPALYTRPYSDHPRPSHSASNLAWLSVSSSWATIDGSLS
jgi:hypothetical protein